MTKKKFCVKLDENKIDMIKDISRKRKQTIELVFDDLLSNIESSRNNRNYINMEHFRSSLINELDNDVFDDFFQVGYKNHIINAIDKIINKGE